MDEERATKMDKSYRFTAFGWKYKTNMESMFKSRDRGSQNGL